MPKVAFDDIDARLLSILQSEFPLVRHPFDAIADALGIATSEVIQRVLRLKRESVIRQISAIFDSAALGYLSALVAFQVETDMLDSVAERISEHKGVSHCYSRDSNYNLWFTITVPPDGDLNAEIAAFANLDGVKSNLILPALKIYKIGVFLDVSDEILNRDTNYYRGESLTRSLTESDRAAVRVLQKDLPIVESPFAELARESDLSEPDLLAYAKHFLDLKIMRRYAAVLRHQRAGYRANAMVCWQVEDERIDEVGAIFASNSHVSHCYNRPEFPDWPYCIYTMVHCRDESELNRVISDLSACAKLNSFRVLRSVKEYKKSRVTYFS